MKLKIRVDKSHFQSQIRGAYNEGRQISVSISNYMFMCNEFFNEFKAEETLQDSQIQDEQNNFCNFREDSLV